MFFTTNSIQKLLFHCCNYLLFLVKKRFNLIPAALLLIMLSASKCCVNIKDIMYVLGPEAKQHCCEVRLYIENTGLWVSTYCRYYIYDDSIRGDTLLQGSGGEFVSVSVVTVVNDLSEHELCCQLHVCKPCYVNSFSTTIFSCHSVVNNHFSIVSTNCSKFIF